MFANIDRPQKYHYLVIIKTIFFPIFPVFNNFFHAMTGAVNTSEQCSNGIRSTNESTYLILVNPMVLFPSPFIEDLKKLRSFSACKRITNISRYVLTMMNAACHNSIASVLHSFGVTPNSCLKTLAKYPGSLKPQSIATEDMLISAFRNDLSTRSARSHIAA